MEPKVKPGDIVLYSDGEEEYPGVITTIHWADADETRAHSVNVYVFPDGSYPGRTFGAETSVQYDADGPDSDATWPTWRFRGDA